MQAVNQFLPFLLKIAMIVFILAVFLAPMLEEVP